jgi:large subunit ribosomal protein L9
MRATAANIAEFETRREELEKLALKKLSSAEERVSALEGFEVILTANASEEGKLYGSIGPREIADAVTAKGINLEKSEVIMGEGPIRFTGDHDVLVHLHADVETQIKVTVNAE